jgi:neopullulanase
LPLLFCFCLLANAQDALRVEPPYWWAGMQNKELQLLVKGDNISTYDVALSSKKVKLVKVNKAESPNYLFLDLMLSEGTTAESFTIDFTKKGSKKISYIYELKARNQKQTAFVDQSDIIYLITPDRFANGDEKNDSVAGMMEPGNRSFHSGRHGGDLQGVINKLDYLENLGVTSLWLNPVVENNMPAYSYHGYAITDYYKVDPRYGSNALYRELSQKLHERKMKLIIDMVFNHCGLEHWWMKDAPFADWIHDTGNYQETNHAIAAFSDPYAATTDLQRMERGWFVPSMPDLNHGNPFMANYLIQNSIWWVEDANLDGIRMDTYPYNDPSVMQQWTARVRKEYPNIYLLGETWVTNEATEAYWGPQKNGSTFNSGLTSITDFPLCEAVKKGFAKDGDVKILYETLSRDFLYGNSFSNTTFVDNHDMDRLFFSLGKDVDRLNLAMTFLLTTRGIPQLYYGTEILMDKAGHHGDIRQDFDGGWTADTRNAFDRANLTPEESKAFDHVQKLNLLRKNNATLQAGSLKHFMPEANVYAYCREKDGERIMIFLNNADATSTIKLSRFQEVINGFNTGSDMLTGEKYEMLDALVLKPKSSLILKLSEINN